MTALGAALRFTGLATQSLWLDEAFTVLAVAKGFGAMLSAVAHTESTPPLYYAAAWAWTHGVGHGEAGLRSLSALAGTLTVPCAHLAARTILPVRGALTLALLAATSPCLVWYSQDARAYALAILLCAASLYFFLAALSRRRARPLAGWAICAAAAVATHYFAAFLVVPEAIWLCAALPRRGRALAAAGAVVAVLVALAPLALAQHAHGGSSRVADAPLVQRIEAVPRTFLVGEYGGPVRGLAPAAALLVLVGLALLLTRAGAQERRAAAVPLVLAAAATAGPLVLALAGFDYLAPRYLTVAWIPAFMVVAAGLGTPAARWAGSITAALLTLVFLTVSVAVARTPRLQRDDWRGAAAALGDRGTPRAILVSPEVGFLPLNLYRAGLRALPEPAVAVSEIDVLVMARGARPRLPAPVPGARPLARIDAPTYSLVRFGVLRGVVRASVLRHYRPGDRRFAAAYEPVRP